MRMSRRLVPLLVAIALALVPAVPAASQDEADTGSPWDAIDEFMLRITLKTLKLVAAIRGQRFAAILDVGQCRSAIDIRLARSEQIEVWAVQQQKRGHLNGFCHV